ncbi:MAG: putative cadmium-transporting ATPase [candidate division WS6 bacterium OLB20]|uniref:Putative cadmium-transporting ATPase n=1 Tax=candidate division WS6 bacterium OLB20 TaxID=1617426 RepID=A0A136LYY1_9BACT|nr:MAG: putative cadmium-transporting ATPase [candidate division WS6 bacterium OLB20]
MFLENRLCLVAIVHRISTADLKRPGASVALLGMDDRLLAAFVFEDSARSEVRSTLDRLRELGVSRQLMLTGDTKDVAARHAEAFGLTEYKADCLPEDKLAVVHSLKDELKQPVVMVGDGINDAPSLAAADVGIAMGILGTSASTEAGSVVITVPDISRVAYSVALSQRVLYIATQSILIGIGLSLVLMIAGALGLFVPVFGAFAQEVIDVIVILNALRVRSYTL